jgi:hypothetical protein
MCFPLPSVVKTTVALLTILCMKDVVVVCIGKGIEKGQNWFCMGKAVLDAVLKGLKQACVSEDQGAHQAQHLAAKPALLGNHISGGVPRYAYVLGRHDAEV